MDVPTQPASAHCRVAHLVVSLAPGGLERLVVDWTNARNRRWPGSTLIVCLDEPGELASQVDGDTVVCLHADRSRSPWDREAVARLRGWLRGREIADHVEEGTPIPVEQGVNICPAEGGTQRPTPNIQHPTPNAVPLDSRPSTLPPADILHAHNLAAWQYAVLAAWGTGVRTVYTQHGANLHNQGLKDRLRARFLAFLTDELVAVSAATARSMSRSLWIPMSGIRVVVNGVEGEEGRVQGSGFRVQRLEERRRIRADLGIPEAALVLGSVGRLAFVKGYDRLIKAMGEMGRNQASGVRRQNAMPNAQRPTPNVEAGASGNPRPSTLDPLFILLLVGDGPERGSLERLAAELGVADRVHFAGFQAEPRPFLQAMDVFVVASRSEGVSMGLLEAMAAGVPVAVTDVGASREVIDDGACGSLLPDDETLWPELLRKVVNDPGRLTALAEQARGRVATHYSMKATLDGYERLYCRLAGTRRRSGCGDDCACGKK